jgi:hypothetical protein
MVERLIVASGGVLSIFLGFLLFRVAELKSDSGGNFKSAIFNISLTKVGPGVFFALFGAYILSTDVKTPIQTNAYVMGLNSSSPSDKSEAIKELTSEIEKLPDNSEKEKIQKILDKLVIPASNPQIQFYGISNPDSLPEDIKRLLPPKGITG